MIERSSKLRSAERSNLRLANIAIEVNVLKLNSDDNPENGKNEREKRNGLARD